MAHPYAETHAESLNVLVRKDGGLGGFPESTKAISLDKVEKSYRKACPHETMDVAVGVIRAGTKDMKNKRMLLCEFRFNVQNWRNISKTVLENKVSYSKELLKAGFEGQIEQKCYFLFGEKIIEQVKNHFGRIYASQVKYRVVSTEQGFKDLLFH